MPRTDSTREDHTSCRGASVSKPSDLENHGQSVARAGLRQRSPRNEGVVGSAGQPSSGAKAKPVEIESELEFAKWTAFPKSIGTRLPIASNRSSEPCEGGRAYDRFRVAGRRSYRVASQGYSEARLRPDQTLLVLLAVRQPPVTSTRQFARGSGRDLNGVDRPRLKVVGTHRHGPPRHARATRNARRRGLNEHSADSRAEPLVEIRSRSTYGQER